MNGERYGEDIHLTFENQEFSLLVDAARHRIFSRLDVGVPPLILDEVIADNEREKPIPVKIGVKNLPYLSVLLESYAAYQSGISEDVSQGASGLAASLNNEIAVQAFADQLADASPSSL
jgi:hypothetical protein